MIDFTGIGRYILARKAARTDQWVNAADDVQRRQLRRIISLGARADYPSRFRLNENDDYTEFATKIPLVEYETLRPSVMRMIGGAKDVLWPGRCLRYAQSSGTSGGKSKYIPITDHSLRLNHYVGAADSVGHYLRANPSSRLFAGKGLILGGSFSNTVSPSLMAPGVRIGDLSATLIDRIPAGASIFRVPSKKIALMPDWSEKLPAIARASLSCNITNLSGVPSWFLTVLREVMRIANADRITDVWPNLEVFFHGGISFAPYRDEYLSITDSSKMHFVETYNASEGFFASAVSPGDRELLLLLDGGIFYEFIPLGGDTPLPIWETQAGQIYEMVITACNGLWRYRLGDTVRVESLSPFKITIAGRTKSFINAFGEEVMEYNAEEAISRACEATGAHIANYTVAPVYATAGRRGRHQWAIEWDNPPSDMQRFAEVLDTTLQQVNSDYEAKRSHTIFLDEPLITTVPRGTFDHWLQTNGTGKLGGQRKVPRLSNDRSIIDSLEQLSK